MIKNKVKEDGDSDAEQLGGVDSCGISEDEVGIGSATEDMGNLSSLGPVPTAAIGIVDPSSVQTDNNIDFNALNRVKKEKKRTINEVLNKLNRFCNAK
jgi:hypothetical protein